MEPKLGLARRPPSARGPVVLLLRDRLRPDGVPAFERRPVEAGPPAARTRSTSGFENFAAPCLCLRRLPRRRRRRLEGVRRRRSSEHRARVDLDDDLGAVVPVRRRRVRPERRRRRRPARAFEPAPLLRRSRGDPRPAPLVVVVVVVVVVARRGGIGPHGHRGRVAIATASDPARRRRSAASFRAGTKGSARRACVSVGATGLGAGGRGGCGGGGYACGPPLAVSHGIAIGTAYIGGGSRSCG